MSADRENSRSSHLLALAFFWISVQNLPHAYSTTSLQRGFIKQPRTKTEQTTLIVQTEAIVITAGADLNYRRPRPPLTKRASTSMLVQQAYFRNPCMGVSGAGEGGQTYVYATKYVLINTIWAEMMQSCYTVTHLQYARDDGGCQKQQR